MAANTETDELKRVFGLPTLVIYGVGDILGAGIYAVVGKIAGLSGGLVWAAFIVAMVVASMTALCYAELGSRLPKSGGVAYFIHTAFGIDWLSTLVGWLMFCTCIVSMATLSRAFAGYVNAIAPGIPDWSIVLALFAGLTFINFRGMKESSLLNIICTTLEVSGLIVVIVVASTFLAGGGANPPVVNPNVTSTPIGWTAVIQGAALAFYAFIGFEDIVNVAEEVKNPQRNVPIAILLSLGIAGVIYILVSWLAVQVFDPATLAASKAPLLDVVARAQPKFPSAIFTIVAAFAVLNTALLNFITSSRLLFGMSREGLLPGWLGRLHPDRSTPYRTFLVILPLAIGLAVSGTVQVLAGATATLILIMFALVNLSLIAIARREPHTAGFRVPLFVPAIALVLNLVLVAFASNDSRMLGLGFMAVGVVLVVLQSGLNKGRKAG